MSRIVNDCLNIKRLPGGTDDSARKTWPFIGRYRGIGAAQRQEVHDGRSDFFLLLCNTDDFPKTLSDETTSLTENHRYHPDEHGIQHGTLVTAITRSVMSTIVLALLLGWFAGDAQSADLSQVVAKMGDDYAAQLESLATWCDEQGLARQAAETRARAKPVDPNVIRVLALPKCVGEASPLADDVPQNVAQWHERYWRLRRDHAQELFLLAHKAIRARRPSLAFDLVYAAAAEDPDNKAVRRLLGYREYRGQWRTPYEIRMLRGGNVYDDRFGWIRKADKARWEKGERPYRGKWISAEKDAQLRRDIHNGWDIETEHFSIRTNHSHEAGVELGRRLEELHHAWKQLFVSYYATPRQIEAMFDRRPLRAPKARHKIVYFRDREQYKKALRGTLPGIENSEGVYIGYMQRAYFFGGDDADEKTLLHEATHQLFSESRPVSQNAGKTANCWVIEGMAVYMESLRKEGDYYVLGGFDCPRMKAARYRLLHDKFYVPFDKLTRYGFPQLQADPKMPTLYSQIAGWTQFLIYYDKGRYRDALMDYLTAVYNGSQNPALLSRLTGTPYEELDRQYHEFIDRGSRKKTNKQQK